MKTRAFVLIVMAFLLLACGWLQVVPTAEPKVTEAPLLTASPTQPLTAEPSATASLPPAPLPTVEAAFYHLRIEFSTTSDWSTLDLLTTGAILSGRLLDLEGEPEHAAGSPNRLELNQPIADAEAGAQVAMTFDLALDAATTGQELDFLLQKGSIRGSTVKVWLLQEGENVLLGEVAHQVVVLKDPGLNPLEFTISLEPLAGIAPQVKTIQPAGGERMLWAFYYPWYRTPDWNSAVLQDHPLKPYDSSQVSVMQQHVQQAQSAGLDGFISSWWGPGDFTDQNLRRLLEVAEEADFKVMAYLETLNESGGRPPDELYRWLRTLITNYGKHPAYMRLDGKPVVVLWATAAVPLADWQDVIERLRGEGLEFWTIGMGYDLANLSVFDGLHDYAVFGYPDLTGTLKQTGQATRYFSLLDEAASPKLWAATVQPGYDERTIPGRYGAFQDRLDGAFYRATWEAAMASNPDWIFITSWNEWWEHTHIEPSEDFGDLYLQITRELVDDWKRGK